MEDKRSVATLMDSTTSKIQQLQKAFAELESHRAVTLNLKWKQLEEHFHGLEKSLKRRFTELEDQEKEFETKIVQSKTMLEKRQAAIISKEQASLENLQEKRDAAVSAITVAMEKNRKVGRVHEVQGGSGSCMLNGKPLDYIPIDSNTEVNCRKSCTNYPELVKLCRDMDCGGLHKFISDNRKNLEAIREEIPHALGGSFNPASLVLDSLKGFYPTEVSVSDAKKDANLLGLRRTCIMLMECLGVLLASLEAGAVSNVISENVKERAQLIVQEWKPTLDQLDIDANFGNSLEAHAFLQLLATFGINCNFKREGLYKLIPMVSRRRQTADLCRSLGLSEGMPGVIDVLVSNGRHLDAVNLAFAFELTDQFSPVSLLRSYLNEASKASSPVKSGNASPTAQNDVNEKQLTALKAVIKCIEEHKLQNQYPVDPLQKRVLQLEKEKADKKRATEVAKPQPKRPRANCIGHGTRGANVVATADKNFYARAAPQYIYDNRSPYAYPGPAIGTAYNLPPGHVNFFGNGYLYQAAPYLH